MATTMWLESIIISPRPHLPLSSSTISPEQFYSTSQLGSPFGGFVDEQELKKMVQFKEPLEDATPLHICKAVGGHHRTLSPPITMTRGGLLQPEPWSSPKTHLPDQPTPPSHDDRRPTLSAHSPSSPPSPPFHPLLEWLAPSPLTPAPKNGRLPFCIHPAWTVRRLRWSLSRLMNLILMMV